MDVLFVGKGGRGRVIMPIIYKICKASSAFGTLGPLVSRFVQGLAGVTRSIAAIGPFI